MSHSILTLLNVQWLEKLGGIEELAPITQLLRERALVALQKICSCGNARLTVACMKLDGRWPLSHSPSILRWRPFQGRRCAHSLSSIKYTLHNQHRERKNEEEGKKDEKRRE